MDKNPELHVHVHFHGPENLFSQMAAKGEQLSFDAPLVPESTVAESAPAKTVVEKPVPDKVTPSPSDVDGERKEISVTSDRNEALMMLDDKFSQYKLRKSYADLVREGKVKMSHHDFQEMEKNKDRLRKEAMSAFTRACGHCAVTKCGIRDNFPAWTRIHTSADVTTPKTESREDWRKRLLADSEAPCPPPKPPKAS